ncbi:MULTISPECIES: hypothetical protein [unclassified Leptolyngbya]|uniref:hypothetical protein n=1 Tax=unclassified Leptolyngbya TaxID=2650499 RepID=UPI001AC45220|nr:MULTISPECIES: hypothetical protein [unclassified Leptolyngbya]MBN8563990.1 hypothetical protein [Leptolyngbya sp. UWPOB_LEPTO1]MCY6492182.1 hypothetical protein [Leptolyngbya sp. GGD]
MSDAIPVIHKEDVPFSCFGMINGTVDVIVSDPQTGCTFPVLLIAHTNLGSGSIPIDISGNGTIHKKIFGFDVDITVSNWHCDQSTVSCHVKAVVKVVLASCQVLDKDFTIPRHNSETLAAAIADLHTRLEASSAS